MRHATPHKHHPEVRHMHPQYTITPDDIAAIRKRVAYLYNKSDKRGRIRNVNT